MTLRSLTGKLGFVFKPFALMSDMALHAVGYRELDEQNGQPIPVKLAVRSALLLVPVYLVASFFLALMPQHSLFAGMIPAKIYQYQYVYGIAFDYCASILWGTVGFFLAPLQVRRVLRLNRRARRHRLSDLERMAKREAAIEEKTLSLARYEVQESSAQLVSQGN